MLSFPLLTAEYEKMLESCLTFEPGYYEFEDHAFFDVDGFVSILGRKFVARTG
jgi:acyl-coenzyme A synthetase/AMP-(fatty) acid ligase